MKAKGVFMRIEYTGEFGENIVITTDANADACDEFEARQFNRKSRLKRVKEKINLLYSKLYDKIQKTKELKC